MPDMDRKGRLHPGMTVLDVVSRYRETEAVFKRYDEQAGECICCQALFESVQDVAKKYHLDLTELLADLESVVPVTLGEGTGIKRDEGP
jgi:hypothetical protein